MFIVLEDLSKKRTLEILESAEKEPNSKIGNAFAHYLDRATVEAKGLTPIKPWLEEIKGLSSKADYASLAAKANRNGVDGPFGAFVGQDDKDPETYILSFSQSGRSEEHTSELQSLMRTSYAVFCLKKRSAVMSRIKS